MFADMCPALIPFLSSLAASGSARRRKKHKEPDSPAPRLLSLPGVVTLARAAEPQRKEIAIFSLLILPLSVSISSKKKSGARDLSRHSSVVGSRQTRRRTSCLLFQRACLRKCRGTDHSFGNQTTATALTDSFCRCFAGTRALETSSAPRICVFFFFQAFCNVIRGASEQKNACQAQHNSLQTSPSIENGETSPLFSSEHTHRFSTFGALESARSDLYALLPV